MSEQYVAVRALNRSANVRVVSAYNVYKLTISATAGQFDLTVTNQADGNSDNVNDAAYNISAADLKTAIAALTTSPDLTSSNITVTGGPGDASGSTPYYISFFGAAGDQDFILTPAAGGTPLSGGTGASVTTIGRNVKLSPTVDTVIDLDRPTNQRALAKHSAIGQWVVTATNDDIHNNALPANS